MIKSYLIFNLLLLTLSAFTSSCASSPETKVVGPKALESISVSDLLIQYGAEHSTLFKPPSGTLDEIKQKMRNARGSEKRSAIRALMISYLYEAEQAQEKKVSARHFKSAAKLAQSLQKWGKDPG